MNRRELLKLGPLAVAGQALAVTPSPLHAQLQMLDNPQPGASDITLTIAPVTVELAPDRVLSTIGYNGSAPGPVLRMKEGKPVTVNVVNQTDTPELVHWHGFHIPAEVDGVEEEGTPFVPAQKDGVPGQKSYRFTPTPAGSRWYHSHVMAMSDLHRGTFTGQFGFVYVEPASEPGSYDQEIFLAIRDWDAFFTSQLVDMDDDSSIGNAPQPERPKVLNTDPNGLEVTSTTYSLNDKALGAGEPIRVKQGDRVLFHFLNASAIENRRISLGGHKFQVIALDGNPVPTPALVETLTLGAAERVCALVEMNNPGDWVLGAPEDPIREAGLGVLVEYANQHREPQWIKPASLVWDYTIFGKAGSAAENRAAAQNIDMIFEKVPRGAGKFNTFLVNGKPYPHGDEFVLHEGQRYRLTFRNRTDDAHPLHLHRHTFELVDMNGTPTSGVMKDTVIVPTYGRVGVEFTANQPGLTLFHCHIQQHMDFGFKALFRYG